MIKRIYLVLLAFFLVISCVNSIDISTCTNLNSAGSTYNLTADILNSGTTNCLDITANNITLNCQGHLISGNGVAQNGIQIYRTNPAFTNYTYITLKNCNLSNWKTAGIYLYKAGGNTLTNITISNITASSSGGGIYLNMYSDQNNIYNLSVFNNLGTARGMFASLSAFTNISLCNIYNNNNSGIQFSTSNYNVISNCKIYNNVKLGIYIYISNINNISSCILYNNSYGIKIDDGSDSFLNNITASNNYIGIYYYGLGPFSALYDTKLSNSNLSQNNYSLYFNGSGEDLGLYDNYVYNNYLGNSSQIYSNFQFNSSNGYFDFNYTDVSGNNYGNYYDDFTCLQTQNVNGKNVCINPSNYTINAGLNIYGQAPLYLQDLSAPVQAPVSTLNSIFPVYGIFSQILALIMLISYFLFN